MHGKATGYELWYIKNIDKALDYLNFWLVQVEHTKKINRHSNELENWYMISEFLKIYICRRELRHNKWIFYIINK